MKTNKMYKVSTSWYGQIVSTFVTADSKAAAKRAVGGTIVAVEIVK